MQIKEGAYLFYSISEAEEKKKNAKKEVSLPFFSRFYIWDEVLLLPSPLHVPSKLSSSHSSSLVSFRCSVLLKLRSSPQLWR